MKRLVMASVVAGAALWVGAANAGGVSPAPSVPATTASTQNKVGDLSQLQAQTEVLKSNVELKKLQGQLTDASAALLKSKIQVVNLQRELAQAKSGKTSSGNGSASASSGGGSGSYQRSMAANAPALPQVVSVTGVKGRLRAMIELSGGGATSYQKGDVLPGGYRILALGANTVRVLRGGRVYTLPWASASTTTTTNQPQMAQPFADSASLMPSAPMSSSQNPGAGNRSGS